MSQIEFAQTQDGSWTCFNAEVHEHYHNLSGAYTEAQNIYVKPTEIEKRLQANNHIAVLDPFLGLGYNTLACMQAFEELRSTQFPQARLTVVAFEKDPEILARLPQAIQNYDPNNLKEFLARFAHNTYYQTQVDSLDFGTILQAKAESGIELVVIVGDTRELVQLLPGNLFDVIYHDAFSPKKQPELWTKQLFSQYRRILKPEQGSVMTYSAAASIRQGFLEAGFHLYALPILENKSGSLACNFLRDDIPELSPLEKALLSCKSGIPYQDNVTLALSREEIVQQRFTEQKTSTLPSSSSIHRAHGFLRPQTQS
jgi:tRNA U34 5-methylaminomethyl-2-thiouridine-forming methyltransferase MnmC